MSAEDGVIVELEEHVAALESALARERARGAVWRLAALNLYTDLDMLYHGGRWPPEIKASAAAVLGAETSPAVAALLELAEAARDARHMWRNKSEDWWKPLDRLWAAVDRYEEAEGG